MFGSSQETDDNTAINVDEVCNTLKALEKWGKHLRACGDVAKFMRDNEKSIKSLDQQRQEVEQKRKELSASLDAAVAENAKRLNDAKESHQRQIKEINDALAAVKAKHAVDVGRLQAEALQLEKTKSLTEQQINKLVERREAAERQAEKEEQDRVQAHHLAKKEREKELVAIEQQISDAQSALESLRKRFAV